MLSRLVEEFDNRLSSQNELMDTIEVYSKHKQTKKEATGEVILKQHSVLQQQSKHVEELKADLETTKAGRHLFSLAHAASVYHKVLEENRKLYNQVQDIKGSIRAYCRARPFLPGHVNSSTVGCIDEGNITIVILSRSGKEGRKIFSFNKVFGPSATQGFGGPHTGCTCWRHRRFFFEDSAVG